MDHRLETKEDEQRGFCLMSTVFRSLFRGKPFPNVNNSIMHRKMEMSYICIKFSAVLLEVGKCLD